MINNKIVQNYCIHKDMVTIYCFFFFRIVQIFLRFGVGIVIKHIVIISLHYVNNLLLSTLMTNKLCIQETYRHETL